MNKVLPLFKSHYSIGRSILTLFPRGSSDGVGPDSIIDICADSGLKELYLVDDSMTGFMEAYHNASEVNIDLRFGLRVNICEDISKKDKDYARSESKCILFCKNKSGYERLLKISSVASTDGFYYMPRIDYESLHKYWSDYDLMFTVPFYDSFIHKNKFNMGNIIPDFSQIKPKFLLEDNDLPFDSALRKHVLGYCEDKYETQEVKSIYYKDKKDFPAYMTFRCISDSAPGRAKRTLSKPNFDHMCSNEFCFESWSKIMSGRKVSSAAKKVNPRDRYTNSSYHKLDGRV